MPATPTALHLPDSDGSSGAAARRPGSRSRGRIPLNTFAIAFGFAGLAGTWSVASDRLGFSDAVPNVLWLLAASVWVALLIAHFARGARSAGSLLDQLRHPAQGPLAALVPIVGMLLGARLHAYWALGGVVLVLLAFVLSIAFAAWILAYWVSGRLVADAVHGGYLLPTVGAGLVAAMTSGQIGLPGAAMAAFAVGIFFWVVIFTVLIARLALLPALPDPLKPTLAILLAPPAVAGIAWFAMRGPRVDMVAVALLGLTVLMAAMQLATVPSYRRLRFSLGFWSFTFPSAATATYAIEWAALTRFPGWQATAIVLVVAVSALVTAIAVRSVVLVAASRLGEHRAEQQLRYADDSVLR